MTMMPSNIVRPRTFQSRIYMRLENNAWQMIADRSDKTLDEQINEWLDLESPAITFMSPPGVAVYQQTPTEQLMVLTISLLYVPAVEGEQNSATKNTVGGVAKSSKSAGQDTAGVIRPEGT